jgi:uncharacterized SAM-binding protein YcdF (DUF218 family)
VVGAVAWLLVGVVVVAVAGWGLGRFLTVDDPLAPAGAIVILGGESGRFSRTAHGVALYKNGYAPQVVFSGGTMADFGVACSSAQLSLDAAQGLGLPAEAVVVAPEAQSTYDEAVNLAQMARAQGWTSLIVVTDAFHTRRAARTFRTLLPGVRISTSVAPNPLYDPARWWSTEQGLVAVVDEVLKLGFYWIRHGVRPF